MCYKTAFSVGWGTIIGTIIGTQIYGSGTILGPRFCVSDFLSPARGRFPGGLFFARRTETQHQYPVFYRTGIKVSGSRVNKARATPGWSRNWDNNWDTNLDMNWVMCVCVLLVPEFLSQPTVCRSSGALNL